MLESLPSCNMNPVPVFRTFVKALDLLPSRFVYLPSVTATSPDAVKGRFEG